MSSHNLLMLPGDGIGPEVINEVERVIEWFNNNTSNKFEIEKDLVGGAAYDEHGLSISNAAMDLAHKCDAIIFGAVGGPKWDNVPFEVRPEAGLLRLRKDLDLFANLRPAICYKALAEASSLKKELVEGLDILILPVAFILASQKRLLIYQMAKKKPLIRKYIQQARLRG